MKIEQNQPLPLQPGPDATVAPAADQPDPAYVAKATKAAVEFERFFISNMLKEMRSSTRAMAPEGRVFNNRVNKNVQGWPDDLLAGNMAGNRAFGIADAILRQLVPGAKAGNKT